jgi:hypothetical protein
MTNYHSLLSFESVFACTQKMTQGQTIKVSVAYFGLIAALMMAMGYTGQFMTR